MHNISRYNYTIGAFSAWLKQHGGSICMFIPRGIPRIRVTVPESIVLNIPVNFSLFGREVLASYGMRGLLRCSVWKPGRSSSSLASCSLHLGSTASKTLWEKGGCDKKSPQRGWGVERGKRFSFLWKGRWGRLCKMRKRKPTKLGQRITSLSHQKTTALRNAAVDEMETDFSPTSSSLLFFRWLFHSR